MFKRLYEWAVSLEQESLAVLETGGRSKGARSTLRANIPGSKVYLAITWRIHSTITFWLNGKEIHVHAPKAHARIEEILGTDTYSVDKGASLKSALPDGLLDALTDAYPEANGLPPTAPRPDTGPGSLAAAE